MRSSGSGVPKMSKKKIINGSIAQNKGKPAVTAGKNKASGVAATRVTKVK